MFIPVNYQNMKYTYKYFAHEISIIITFISTPVYLQILFSLSSLHSFIDTLTIHNFVGIILVLCKVSTYINY